MDKVSPWIYLETAGLRKAEEKMVAGLELLCLP